MSSLDGFKHALRQRGLRSTPQRQLILETISTMEGHLSAEAIHRRVHQVFPEVNPSTVYRTLELLQEMGLVSHTHFHDGVALYHRAEEGEHQHLICQSCGREQQLDMAELAPLRDLLRERYQFVPDLAHVAIVGHCEACPPRHQH
jgi:Fur family ferric uptake transcriptional regulator